jgi:hypothetical protein
VINHVARSSSRLLIAYIGLPGEQDSLINWRAELFEQPADKSSSSEPKDESSRQLL